MTGLPLRRHLFSAYKSAEMGDEQTAGDFEQRIRHAGVVYNGLREKPGRKADEHKYHDDKH